MCRSGEMLVDNQVVMRFRTRLESYPNGVHRLVLETLTGVIVGDFEGKSVEDVECQLRHAGYERIPPAMADDLDVWSLGDTEKLLHWLKHRGRTT